VELLLAFDEGFMAGEVDFFVFVGGVVVWLWVRGFDVLVWVRSFGVDVVLSGGRVVDRHDWGRWFVESDRWKERLKSDARLHLHFKANRNPRWVESTRVFSMGTRMFVSGILNLSWSGSTVLKPDQVVLTHP
jgi:hypothetical protein